MAPLASDLPIVLYHYEQSPYAQRIVWYLNLRKIPYSQCIQPRIMPRPDLSTKLGISYRRIPILSIGRDVYLDTRLILTKLESLYPPSASHPGISGAHATSPNPLHTALEQLISARVTDSGLFMQGVQCFPAGVFAGDAAFLRDRAGLVGVDMSKPGAVAPLSGEVLRAKRPEALAALKRWIVWLEEGVLRDGGNGDWIVDSNANGAGPSLADLEAGWLLRWVSSVPGALPSEVLSERATPRVFAWLKRLGTAVAEAGKKAVERGDVKDLKGEEAARVIVGAGFAETEGEVNAKDSVVDAKGLKKGVDVRMWPTDYGSSHRDSGKLVAVDDAEFVIEVKGTAGSVRLHAPRQGFAISRDERSVASKM